MMINSRKSKLFWAVLAMFAAVAFPASRIAGAEHGAAKQAAHGAAEKSPAAPAPHESPKPDLAKHDAPHAAGTAAPTGHEQHSAAANAHEAAPAHASPGGASITAAQGVAMLKEGNARYVADKPHPIHIDAHRRSETASGQKPFVTIVSCSDSRVAPELIFDQGIGEMFIVRVAGNVCGDDELGSIEYAVEHLHTPLVLVMGHSRCGAVTAAASGEKMPGHIASLVKDINPAVATAHKAHPELLGEAIVPEAIVANAYRGIEHMLSESEIIRAHASAGQVRIEAAIYDIATGQVEWLGPHPRQAKLLEAGETHSNEGASNDVPASTRGTAKVAAVVHIPNAHAAPRSNEAMSEALTESARNEAGNAHRGESANAGAAMSRPSATETEPRVQPTPHSLPGLLERCMAEELYRLGVQHLDKGEYAEAASRFQAAAGIDPSMLAARNDLAGVYCMQQKYKEALELYTAILEVDGQYRFAMRGAALCHASLKQYDQARAMLNRLLTTDRRDARTWLELGDVCFLDNDAAAARQFWMNAARVNDSAGDVIKQANTRLKVYPTSGPAENAQAAR